MTKDQVYKSEDIYKDIENLNRNKNSNNDIRKMRLKIMDINGYLKKHKNNKISKNINELECTPLLFIIAEKNIFSDTDALNYLKVDLKNFDTELDNYKENVNELKLKNSKLQGKARSEFKKRNFSEFFSSNQNILNFKTKPILKVKVVKKIEKYDK